MNKVQLDYTLCQIIVELSSSSHYVKGDIFLSFFIISKIFGFCNQYILFSVIYSHIFMSNRFKVATNLIEIMCY